MLGWYINVYRQRDGGTSPATATSAQGAFLAGWQADWDGLKWLDELVKAGKVTNLGGDGYPLRYTATSENLLPHLAGGPPAGGAPYVGIPADKWKSLERAAFVDCRPDEWLLIEAWDAS